MTRLDFLKAGSKPDHKESATALRRILFVVALAFGFSFSAAHAATGLNYLSAQQNPDGSFGNTATSLATPVQTTVEVLRAYQTLGQQAQPAYTPALGYLNGDNESNTEFLARKIIVNAQAGNNVSALVSELLANRNTDGGFGDKPGDASSVLDTAYALEALATAGYSTSAVISGTAGFLLSRQQADGGWKEGDNATSVFLTAQVVRALTPYRNTYQGISGAIQSAQNYLLSQRVNGLWAEPHDSALALIALLPVTEPSLLSASVSALNAQQQANGSWVDDPYTTALVLRALGLALNPPPDPSLGVLKGRVVDAATGVALANVTVTLNSTPAKSVLTDTAGRFQLNGLAPGAYSLTFSLVNYSTVSAQVGITANATTDVGTIPLVKVSADATGTVRGVVTDATTGLPIGGVAVSATGALPVVTDAAGAYQIANVPAGAVTITATKAGYISESGGATLTAGAVLVFSPALQPQTDTAAIQGRVVDAASAMPIAGASVTLSGPASQSATTPTTGTFSFTGLPAGVYTLNVTAPGYFGLSASLSASGGTFNIGDLALSQDTPATTGTVRGTVTDADTGLPLAGAVVSAGGLSATTDANGAYSIANVAPGEVVVQASMTGYASAVAAGNVSAGGVLVFSPALTPQAAQLAVLEGVVTDAATNAPLAGVSISVTGASTVSTVTDAQGRYRLDGLNPGAITVTASLAGYDSVTAGGTLTGNTTTNFSPKLYPSGETPPDANTAGITGAVLDAGTNQPLSGVSITATFDTVTTLNSDAQGHFSLEGLTVAQGHLRFVAAGYVTAEVDVALEPLEVLDMGQIRLRREGVEVLLPDLVVGSIDRASAPTDTQTLVLSGTLAVEIINHGTANALADVTVLAFHDANGDGKYGVGDTVLGQAATQTALAVGATTTIMIPVAGELPFRDAPIHVFVDSAQAIAESDENNNVLATSNACRRVPGSGGPVELALKWHWRGPPVAPNAFNIFGPPVVARLTDTNGDGKIDEQDVPNLVFTSFASASQGILNVVNGADGSQVWANTTAGVTSFGSAALADIDGDGLVDIVISNRNRTRLLAFNHDGSLKWSVPTGPTHPDITRDGVAIADLDGDGSPEIIHGRRIYRADGTLKWQGTRDHGGETSYGLLPIAADVNLDGRLEVSAGRTLYDADGNVLWHRSDLSSDGFTAVGNFDDDDFAEIVLVANGRVHLLEHTGQTIWGPVLIPGGGRGGAPTVADFDGDGKPEIGVAGANNYVVFDTDGSILWTARTRDLSSHRTGSSVFDFDGDGKAEILYADEVNFFIYDGATGAIRLSIPNGSGTTLEYPIVVDVNNDGQANIVLTSGDAGVRGVRVFESAGAPWPATRAIWNQHAYHIDNINDDGTVPSEERPSWLTHNTYRLNTFPDRNPLDVPDATASLFRLVDNGAGQAASLTLRVGNAGAAPTPAGTLVAFYQGEPSAGGILLGSLTLEPLAPGSYRDLRLDDITLPNTADLHAVIDPDNRVVECDKTNNRAQIPVVPATVHGNIGVFTDAVSYGPGSPAQLNASVTNTGSFTTGYTATLRVEDAGGELVVQFAPRNVGPLASGASAQATEMWSTGSALSGPYRLRGVLRDPGGQVIDEAVSDFVIVHDVSGAAVATLRTTTDRPVYHTTDQVQIQNLVGNVSVNTLISGASLRLRVFDPLNQVIFTQDIPLSELVPGALRDLLTPMTLNGAAVAIYRVVGEVVDAAGQNVLAASQTNFEVKHDLGKSLTGLVTVEHDQREAGQSQSCTDVITNIGTTGVSGLELHRLVVNLGAQQLVSNVATSINLSAGESRSLERSFGTGGLTSGHYACVLQARIDNELKTLAYAAFVLTEPTIRVDAEMRLGTRGRLLVLLDHPVPASGAATSDRDPFGPDNAPGLTAQRAFLENILRKAGWSYTITDTAEDFARELRTGGYSVYALFSEHEKLAEQVQKELREAVFRGEGLIEAGSNDQRQGRVDEALGIKYIGQFNNTAVIEMMPSPLHPGGQEAFIFDDRDLRVEPQGAQAAGRYLGVAGRNVAVTFHEYGVGKSVYAGFDLLAQAAAAGEQSLFAALLLNALNHVHPANLALMPGAVVPVEIVLNNQGVAAQVKVQLSLPAGSVVADAGSAQVNDGVMTWETALAVGESKTLTFWLRLPAPAGQFTLTARVFAGTNSQSLQLVAQPNLTLTVNDPESLTNVVNHIDVLLGSRHPDGQSLRQARRFIEKALGNLHPALAIADLLKAADFLADSDDPEVISIRVAIGLWIRWASPYAY